MAGLTNVGEVTGDCIMEEVMDDAGSQPIRRLFLALVDEMQDSGRMPVVEPGKTYELVVTFREKGEHERGTTLRDDGRYGR